MKNIEIIFDLINCEFYLFQGRAKKYVYIIFFTILKDYNIF